MLDESRKEQIAGLLRVFITHCKIPIPYETFKFYEVYNLDRCKKTLLYLLQKSLTPKYLCDSHYSVVERKIVNVPEAGEYSIKAYTEKTSGLLIKLGKHLDTIMFSVCKFTDQEHGMFTGAVTHLPVETLQDINRFYYEINSVIKSN